MSLALYRKYRPSTFAEVIGQEHVTEPLQQALRNNRVHHAYLFSGPRGCGKTSSARILARSLNCEQGPTPTPCGVCDSCTGLAPSGPGSIDVIEIDAASHGGVDDARDLRDRSFYAPISSRYKIYIIDEAHMVTTAGFNALLKLVEEPPPHLKFIFATTEPDKVIGTIRSRTHHYPFRLVPPGALRDNLARICVAENVEIEPAALGLVVRAGAGSVRDAQSVLDQLVAGAATGGVTYRDAVALLGYTDASLLDDVVDAFGAHDGGAVLEIIDRVMEAGHDPRRFAEDLLERLRDLIVLNAVPDAGEKGLLDAPVDVLERMSRQSAQLGRVELTRAADIVNTGLTEMRGATAPRLLLELICARVLLPAASDDEASLLVRLERLERRFAIAAPPPGASAEVVGITARSTASSPTQLPEPALEVVPEPALEVVPEPALEVVPEPALGVVPEPALGVVPAAAPAASPVPVPAARAPGAALPATADIDATAVRQLWDDILDVVKGLPRGRTTQPLIAQNAQVLEVRAGTLVLGFTSGPLERLYKSGAGDELLRQALKEVLGVDWRIETTLSGGEPTGSGTASSAAAASVEPPLTPSEAMAADRAPSRAASGGRVAKQPRPAEIVLDEAHPDDDDADDGASGLALLQSRLGATVINDGERS